jgi:membrane peptidoglycan carboxypeptidase
MTNNVRWRRPQAYIRAIRKLGARAAALSYAGRKRKRVSSPVAQHMSVMPTMAHQAHQPHVTPTSATAMALASGAASASPSPPTPPRKTGNGWRWFKWIFWLTFFGLLGFALWWALIEVRTSAMQAEFFANLGAKVKFHVEAGPSPHVRYPKGSPYDERLGYANLPDFLSKLKARDYQISSQARISPKMEELADLGLFAPYREKTQVGLAITDCRNETMFSARYPERIYPRFEDTPPILINSLLFIENRELLDPTYPKRNPAVEWDRLSKAVLDQALHGFNAGHKSAGGSTLATQIEKYRHSPEGRTSSLKEKLRQMVSASLRAYQSGQNTTEARRRIVLDYLNTVPLSAKPGYGEVNGIGDGMSVWYGRDFAEVNRLLQGDPAPAGKEAALAYKQALSLIIAQRRPSYYLGDDDNDLEQLTNSHLRLLAGAGVIPTALRDSALPLHLTPSSAHGQGAASFVNRKASTAVRTSLAGMLGDSRLYNLDRLDLSVSSTLDAQAQQAVSAVLRDLRNADSAQAAGLQGKGMLGNGDPAQVVYSVTLLERGADANYLRLQTDNFDQPLDINDGAKLDLGSTAKLRTLVSYLDIVSDLHRRYHGLDQAQLDEIKVDPKDKISRWAVDYLSAAGPLNGDAEAKDGADAPRALRPMLEAALERQYSANPAEGFFTGGGMHHFGNFRHEDDGRVMSVRMGLRNSVNLVFVRLLRDVVHYYMFQTPGSSASLLQDADDPRRAAYLSRFADREGREFMRRFYPKYQGKSADQAQKILMQNVRPTPNRLASIFRTIAPDATIAQFDAFFKENLPSQNEVSAEKLARLYLQFAPENMSLADRGYLANVHPLELWIVGFLRAHPGATQSQVMAASDKERQAVYYWLFNTHRKHAQDKRILSLLEVEGFLEIHRQWKRMGYPFDSLVPSYATALGASADRPAALAELMGIIVNDGVRKPSLRIKSLHFASGTPYETVLGRKAGKSELVLAPEVAQAVAGAIRQVVSDGTAKRVKSAFVRADGTVIPVGGKTGTGDQRFDVYGAGGRLIESRFVNRSATFVFNIGGQFYGSITAYVHGPQAENYDFTSALPVQLLKVLAPSLMHLIEPGAATVACGG